MAAEYNLDSFPTIVFIRNHKVLMKVIGYDPEGVERAVNGNMLMEPDTLVEVN